MNRFSRVPSFRRAKRVAPGFTLVELLVAVAVFALMMGLVSQMLDMTTRAAHMAHQEMTAADGTRRALDALGGDLENLANANGLSVLVSSDQSNNTVLSFLTESRGPAGTTSRFMAVAYELSEASIIRSVTPIPWNQPQVAAATANLAGSGVTSMITPNALRFQTVLLLDNGTTLTVSQSALSSTASAAWKTSTVNGETLPSGTYGLVLSTPPVDPNNPRVSGLMVGVAVLDEQSIKMGNASQMGEAFGSPQNGETPMDVWEVIQNSSSFVTGYPAPAVQALSLGQQIYTLK